MFKIFGRWLIATLTLTVLAGISAALVRAIEFEPPPGMLWWALLSNGITAACLMWLAANARMTGVLRAAALFAVWFGLSYFTGLIEAYFFDVLAGRVVTLLLVQSALCCAMYAPFVAWLSGAPEHDVAQSRPLESPALSSFAMVAVLYTAIYFAAGILVYPFVETYYASRQLPSATAVVSMQLFVRGPMLAALIALILRLVEGPRMRGVLAAGVLLSVLGGVAPLIVPNPVFPDAVRFAHLVEVGVSNFLFGMAAAWILSGRMPALNSQLPKPDSHQRI